MKLRRGSFEEYEADFEDTRAFLVLIVPNNSSPFCAVCGGTSKVDF